MAVYSESSSLYSSYFVPTHVLIYIAVLRLCTILYINVKSRDLFDTSVQSNKLQHVQEKNFTLKIIHHTGRAMSGLDRMRTHRGFV